MNVLSAMAGISDGEFCKKFTKEDIDIITLGGFNLDDKTIQAAKENIKNNRKEFIIPPKQLSEVISTHIRKIHEYNPSWNGKISVNLRASNKNAYSLLYDNEDIDVIEINAHCRQQPMLNAGTGQALLHNTKLLEEILEEVTSNWHKKVGVKIRANVEKVNTLDIIEILNSYNVHYIHVDAMNPGIMEADLDMINKIASATQKHIIGNNCVRTYEDYSKMLESGADSVSVARIALQKENIHQIFKKS